MPRLETSGAIRKLKRLTSMGVPELAHRLIEKGYVQLERIGCSDVHRHGACGIVSKDDLWAAARGFYGAVQTDRSFIQQRFPSWIDRAVEEADRLARHEFELLSLAPVQLDRNIDWHCDPVTGRRWERRFWADYDPERDPEGRDSKVIHELNRHQHLPRLAKAYAWTGDERYAAEVVAQLESWIEQNPPGYGINWQSSLEIGIRAISWMWAMFLLLPSKALGEQQVQRISASLFAQLEHVYRHTSRYSSPNTHLIGEAAALCIAGLTFRDRDRPAAWLRRGSALLLDQSKKQILKDGAYGELSSYYHCYALDFYLQVFALAAEHGFETLAPLGQPIGRMLKFLSHLTRPDGSIPLLGDDDGGRALALERTNYRSFTDALGSGAVVFGREDFKHQAGDFPEEVFWLLGDGASDRFDQIEGTRPAAKQIHYADAGYAIQRSGCGPSESHLIFDCGGLGMLTGGHSHADALSLNLFSRGKELLVDPGTYVYNGAPEWREYFRSTRAHNTVVVDGKDQAIAGGSFRWKTRMNSRAASDPDFPAEYLEAKHDGYASLGIVHRRRVLSVPGEYWIVADDFRGSGSHTFEFCYHFGAGLNPALASPNQASVTIRDQDSEFSLAMFASSPITARLQRGETNPAGGWVSRGYGDKRPSASLHAAMTAAAPASALTFLVADPDPPVIRPLAVKQGNAIACSVEGKGFRDLVVFATGTSEIQVEDFRMRGELFRIRMRGSAVTHVVAIRGSLQRIGSDQQEAACAQSAA